MKVSDEGNNLITLSEAAQLRGTSISALSHLVRRGRLRSVERYGKTLVYKAEVESFEPDKGGRPPKPKSAPAAEKRATKQQRASTIRATTKKRKKR